MDKAPNFGLAFFYRVVLPGALLTFVSLPLIDGVLGLAHLRIADLSLALLAGALVVGFLVSIFDDWIYQLYEGRTGWPDVLKAHGIDVWKERVREVYNLALDTSDPSYNERWAYLRQFPTDADRVPTATAPTRLGNILAQYEADYPLKRYGLDAVFFWPRLWLLIDKDTREEIDKEWAPTDCLLYLSAGCNVVALLYLLAVVVAINLPTGTPWLLHSGDETWLALALGVLGLTVVAWGFYQLSIPGHIRNGEVFKSAVDIYRHKLSSITPADKGQRDQLLDLSDRLQYGEDDS
jgi:hypothetical protein